MAVNAWPLYTATLADYFEKGGFTGSVQTEYAYFSSVEKTEVDVLEDCFVRPGICLGHSGHGKNDLVVVCHDFYMRFLLIIATNIMQTESMAKGKRSFRRSHA